MNPGSRQPVSLIVGGGLALLLNPSPALAQPSTTVITHGFQLGSCESTKSDITATWMRDMAGAIIARSGGQGAVVRYEPATGAWLVVSGTPTPGEPVVLLFDWIDESNGDILGSCPPVGTNWGYAQAAGDALYAAMREPGPGSGLPRGFDLVAGRTIHLIGHSRGTVVNSYAAGRFGADGLTVDQVTTLDPHPVNATLDICFIPASTNWGDETPVKWANVIWADNYWRADGTDTFLNCDFDGMPLNPAQVVNLQLNATFGEPTTPGGGSDPNLAGTCDAEHSKVHAWYLGTIPLNPPVTYPNECPISYGAWYAPALPDPQGYDFSALGAQSGGTGHGSTPGTPLVAFPIIHNGGFEHTTFAGWAFHGGAAGGTFGTVAGNPYARLTPAAPQLAHNRFFIRGCGGLRTIMLRALREGAAGANDQIRVRMSLVDGSGGADVVGPIAVSTLATTFTTLTGAVPAALGERACLLSIIVEDAAAGAVTSVIGIDDVSMTGPADIDASGAVDGIDLGSLLAQWTGASGYSPCPPPRPADLNGDCRVDGLDLASLLAAWGRCGR